MAKRKKARVAIIGVGNCASSLVQGVRFYKDASDDVFVPGLMHVNLGGYHVSDIEFTAAFDVDKYKVGLDLSEAIWQPPNNTIKFADVGRPSGTWNRCLMPVVALSTAGPSLSPGKSIGRDVSRNEGFPLSATTSRAR